MTAEKKETLKVILLWTYRGILTISVYFIGDMYESVNTMAKDIRDIKTNMLLYEYQIKSLQAENAILKMDMKDNNKEDAIQHTAIWQHLAQLKTANP